MHLDISLSNSIGLFVWCWTIGRYPKHDLKNPDLNFIFACGPDKKGGWAERKDKKRRVDSTSYCEVKLLKW